MALFGAYRKKPVVIHAVQTPKKDDSRFVIKVFFDHLFAEVKAAKRVENPGMPGYNLPNETFGVVIETLEGDHVVTPGDWIVMGVRGEYYPVKPDIFEATYEKA